MTVARYFRDKYYYSDNEYNPQDDIRHIRVPCLSGGKGPVNHRGENQLSLRDQTPLRDVASLHLSQVLLSEQVDVPKDHRRTIIKYAALEWLWRRLRR